jgi:hypothetical protein
MDLPGRGEGPLAAACEMGNELLYFTKCGEFHNWLTKIPWS